MKKAAFIGDGHQIARVYHGETMASLQKELDFIADGTCLVKSDFDAVKEELAEVEYLFSTWGMLALSAEEIRDYLPACILGFLPSCVLFPIMGMNISDVRSPQFLISLSIELAAMLSSCVVFHVCRKKNCHAQRNQDEKHD